MKRSICILLSIIISISAAIYNIGALTSEIINTVEISLDENFADNRVIIVLNNKSSLSFKDYTISDFDGLNIKSIKNLSESSGQMVKAAMTNVAEHITANVPLIPYDGIALSNYKQIICLELSTPGKSNVISTIKELQKRDDVLLVAPDYELIPAAIEPTDPYYQSNMNDTAEYIGLEDAWDIVDDYCSSTDTVKVGIIDSGIDGEHPDLENNIDTNLSINLTQDLYSINNDKGLIDSSGHGTMCASVVGAIANNGEGSAGACWNVELVSLKVRDEDGRYYSSYVTSAIDYAQSNGIPILSMSLGWYVPNNRTMYGYYNDIINSSLSDYTGLFICSAGNDGWNLDNDIEDQKLPAEEGDIANKIVVGSSIYNRISDFSNTGEESVNIYAPGEDWYLAFPSEKCRDGTHFDMDHPETLNAHEDVGYHRSSGTSMSAPLVAATAAMMLCINSDLDNVTLKCKILNTGYPHDNFVGHCTSGRRLDVEAAVLSAVPTCDHTGDVSYGLYNSDSHRVWCDDCDELISVESHEGSFTNYGSSGHMMYCSLCTYSGMRDHDIYISAIYNDVYTIKCHECSYVKNCSCSREYEADGNTEHNVTCTDCGYSLVESHTYEQTGEYDSSGHEIECAYCYYSEYVDHDLYMYSAETEDYTVKCRGCDYSVRCTQCPEYYGTDGTGHWVDCPDGCYSFFEPHTPGSYTDIDEPSHEVVCADCGCTYYEDHKFEIN